ncbi:class I lanthipeptide [Pseudomonas shirazensis]
MKNISLNNKLYFKKADVTELNDNFLREINGGSTIIGGETCTGCCCLQTSIILQDM